VRLNRLAVAADDAIAAADQGDFAQMHRHLRRFVALTSAIWPVQQAVAPGEKGAIDGTLVPQTL